MSTPNLHALARNKHCTINIFYNKHFTIVYKTKFAAYKQLGYVQTWRRTRGAQEQKKLFGLGPRLHGITRQIRDRVAARKCPAKFERSLTHGRMTIVKKNDIV